MEDFDSYLKGILSQVMGSYKILENLKDKPGDLEIISRELAKVYGLLQVIYRKLDSKENWPDKYVKLSIFLGKLFLWERNWNHVEIIFRGSFSFKEYP